ncbi:MAG: amidohydrolase family protein [Ignavibacteriae bacterium]|nr:amidohydrolase family protein [Ignavibacteriota bacterium]
MDWSYGIVNLIPMTQETVITNQTITIFDGWITQISKSHNIAVPAGTTIIDGNGKYLMPGMADMHAHLPGKDGQPHNLHDYLLLQLAGGVTTIRVMRGDESHLSLRDSVNQGLLLGPTLYIACPALRLDSLASFEQVKVQINKYKHQGFGFVKLVSVENSDLLQPVADYIHSIGLKFTGHCPEGGLELAVKANMESIEHYKVYIDLYKQDSLKLWTLLNEMAEKKLFSCPTLYWSLVAFNQFTMDGLRETYGLSHVNAAVAKLWVNKFQKQHDSQLGRNIEKFLSDKENFRIDMQLFLRILKQMQEAGVPLLVSPSDGSFCVPGFSMTEELRLVVQAGLTPYQALRAATYNAADFFDDLGNSGTVEVGKKANLILLDKNPLEDIEHVKKIDAVIKNGSLYKRKDILQQLKK